LLCCCSAADFVAVAFLLSSRRDLLLSLSLSLPLSLSLSLPLSLPFCCHPSPKAEDLLLFLLLLSFLLLPMFLRCLCHSRCHPIRRSLNHPNPPTPPLASNPSSKETPWIAETSSNPPVL
jgi:hypothetical protein